MPKYWVDIFQRPDGRWGYALLMGRAAGCIAWAWDTEAEAFEAAADAYIE